ncbi:hypothetical protein CGZ95_03900 [Enemella evansiae]|uniref:hypothetical protein n=1 Tax=Enemella evansiae TaxID=2016499 RepID=UPI000B95DF60|nr:hypothetical protein [Enemella evansiae]OYO04458.1 hypothetical protein CGZ95_03900 [Enemella evansiae]
MSPDPAIELAPGLGVLLVAAGLLVLAVAGLRARGLLRILLVGQAVYWAIGYLGRAIVLLTVQPRPAFADNLADPRLYQVGYDRGVAAVLTLIVPGIWCYALLALILVEVLRARRWSYPDGVTRRAADSGAPAWLPVFWVVYAIGMLARAATMATGTVSSAGEVESANPYLATIASLAGIAAIALVFHTRGRPLQVLLVLGLLGAGELGWGMVTQSKTPAIGIALALALRIGRVGLDRRRALALVGTGAVVIAAFGWLQSFKTAGAATDATFQLNYPAPLRPFLPLLTRFDLFQAATDVYAAVGPPWYTPGQAAGAALLAFIPAQLGVTKVTSGTVWAELVRGSSVDMREVSVSLAEGHLSEGLLLAGLPGVLVESLILLAVLLLVVRGLESKHIFLAAWALTMVQTPALFERGVLGIAETAGKGLQGALAIWLLTIMLKWLRWGPAGAPTTDRPSRVPADPVRLRVEPTGERS